MSANIADKKVKGQQSGFVYFFDIFQSFGCSQCGKKLKTQVNLRRHELTCKKYKWQCKSCDTFLSTKQKRDNHEPSCQRKKEKEREELQEKQQEGSNTSTPGKTSRYVCGVCDKPFKNRKPFLRHRETHYKKTHSTFTCRVCQQQFPTRQQLASHFTNHPSGSGVTPSNSKQEEEKNGSDSRKKPLKCSDCEETFERWHELLNHRTTHHGPEDLQQQQQQPQSRIPWEVDRNLRPPWIEIDEDGIETINTKLKAVYEQYRLTIDSGHDQGKVRAIYNFPVNDFNGHSEDLFHHLSDIFSREEMSFRINLAFGVILRNVETGEYRYYAPYYNSTLLDNPVKINNRSDLIALFRRLEGMELMDMLLKTKDSTKWQKVFFTNVSYYVYRTAFPIGAMEGVVLPNYINRKTCIIGFQNTRNSEPYKDNLCIFRCLTYAQLGGRTANFENTVKGRYTKWKEFLAAQGRTDLPSDAKKYKGVLFTDLPDFEQCFDARITVFSLHPNKTCTRLYVSSLDVQTETATELNLNLYERHFSYIKNFDTYAQKYACGFCGHAFKELSPLKRHTQTCDSRVKNTFPGGLYTPQITIFEEMRQTLSIEVERNLQFYPWFCVYDFEAVLKKIPQDGEDGTRFTTEHVPVCVSIASNVPGYESPHCIIDSDPDNLVKRMCEFLHQIQTVTSALASDRWKDVFEQLETVKDMFQVEIDENNANTEVGDDQPASNLGEKEKDPEKAHKLHAKRVATITDKFKKYVSRLPTLGFNSSRYDLNLIKKYFPKHLELATQADYIIKKTNEYSAIATPKLKFLDISNYLAAGCSYSKFLKAYDVSESKSYFPYEWFDDVSKLDFPRLPDYADFKSSLRNANVLAVEYTEWVESGGVGERPKTGPEKYQDLLTIWQEKGMTTLADFLQYYVNLDTGPFVKAAEKLRKYYWDMQTDVFKEALSSPGVARKLLFQYAKESNIHFTSFSEENADLYYKLKRCAFGGPSIVYKRYAKVDETCIRNNKDVLCKSIQGHDCNSMYSFAYSEALPVLFPIRRSEETGFYPKVTWKHLDMYMWMNWLMKCNEGLHIQHKLNSGQEFPVGPYRLDGYSTSGNRKQAYEFNGCFTHGHSKEECKFKRNANMTRETREFLAKQNAATKSREAYIRSMGIELTVIYECEFSQIKRDNPNLKSVISDMLPQFYMNHPRGVKTDLILAAVESGELTGMVQVDIRVPEVWPEKKKRNMSPQEYFSEMAPIFCNSEVHFDHWGSTMQNFSFSHQAGGFTDSRKLLIGGMAATKIFLATNLLKWYLEKGLEVTKVYEVVEYKFMKCFETFSEYISEARRQGDRYPSKEVLGETCKVLGNAAYGSLLIDKTKHIRVKYVQERSQAHMAVNDPLFKKLTELPHEMFEVEMSKRSIRLDTPIQLAFCILGTAKLKLLQFYYDCLDYYLDRKDFELTHMDTDSLYFSLNKVELADAVIPSKREEFQRALLGHCNDRPFKAADGFWFPRQCCATHINYDKRERGLFKLEASGTELIALAPKTYFLRRPEMKDIAKAKGVNRSALVEPRPLYSRALFDKTSSSVKNIGFRAHQNKMVTYTQTRRGFSYLYVKRVVQENGIDTVPLQIVLNPWEDFNAVVVNSRKHCISISYQASLQKDGKEFRSCSHLFLFEKALFNNCPDVAVKILAATTDRQLQQAAKRIKVCDSWYDNRVEIMHDALQLKIQTMKAGIVLELKSMKGKMLIHPGDDNFWTCGLSQKLAEITSPIGFTGEDWLSRFWETLARNEEFMNS